jgi:hypothetical protein
MKKVVARQWIPLFSIQKSSIQNPFEQKLTLQSSKTKQNIVYIVNREGVISIFLTENHILWKIFKKRENFLEILVVGPKSSLCKSIKICPFFENPYIFWKKKLRRIFLS